MHGKESVSATSLKEAAIDQFLLALPRSIEQYTLKSDACDQKIRCLLDKNRTMEVTAYCLLVSNIKQKIIEISYIAQEQLHINMGYCTPAQKHERSSLHGQHRPRDVLMESYSGLRYWKVGRLTVQVIRP